jgi:hypothetical protein
VSPQNKKRGRVAHLSNPATSGTQYAGKPKANGGGKTGGSRGRKPPGRGFWGVSPQNKKRGELPTLATPPRVGPNTLANPKPTGVGKWGVQGAQAPWQGVLGGVPPEPKKMGVQGGKRVAHLSNPATSGAQAAGKPKANGGGKMWGSRGRKPPGRGFGGCPPRTKRGGELPTLATPPRVGPNTLANPKPTGVGKPASPSKALSAIIGAENYPTA